MLIDKEIMKILEICYFPLFGGELRNQKAKVDVPVHYQFEAFLRGSGRTTRSLVQAMALSQKHKVLFIAHSMEYAKDLNFKFTDMVNSHETLSLFVNVENVIFLSFLQAENKSRYGFLEDYVRVEDHYVYGQRLKKIEQQIQAIQAIRENRLIRERS